MKRNCWRSDWSVWGRLMKKHICSLNGSLSLDWHNTVLSSQNPFQPLNIAITQKEATLTTQEQTPSFCSEVWQKSFTGPDRPRAFWFGSRQSVTEKWSSVGSNFLSAADLRLWCQVSSFQACLSQITNIPKKVIIHKEGGFHRARKPQQVEVFSAEHSCSLSVLIYFHCLTANLILKKLVCKVTGLFNCSFY